jgi:chromosome segregation ATPase
MWKDIERISGVPFSRSTTSKSVRHTNNSSLLRADGHTNGDSEETRRLNALRSALNKENESNASIRAELASAKVALIDANTRANEAEETNRLLLQSVNQLRQENETKSNEVLQLTADKAAHLHEFQAKINELQQTIFRLTTSNDDLVTNLEVKQQQKLKQEAEIKTLEERIISATVEREAAEIEMRDTLVKLEQTQQQLKDSEACEQDVQLKQREAAEEVTKLTAKFQLERESMTKVRFVLPTQCASTLYIHFLFMSCVLNTRWFVHYALQYVYFFHTGT